MNGSQAGAGGRALQTEGCNLEAGEGQGRSLGTSDERFTAGRAGAPAGWVESAGWVLLPGCVTSRQALFFSRPLVLYLGSGYKSSGWEAELTGYRSGALDSLDPQQGTKS